MVFENSGTGRGGTLRSLPTTTECPLPPFDDTSQPARTASLGKLGTVCRLGLASRGNTRLEPSDVQEAVRRGVNYLNWCGHPDGLSQAVRLLGEKRSAVFVAVQLQAHTAKAARLELTEFLGELGV